MKRILLLIICCTVISLYAEARNRKPYKPKSEITLRWGLIGDEDWCDWQNDNFYYNSRWGTPLERYNSGKYYKDDRIDTEAITLSYTRELKRWLALSLNGTYFGSRQHLRETETSKIIKTYKRNCFSFFPMVRFTYLNRPMVRLYSAVGLGFGLTNEDGEKETYLDGQMTFFGVSVGKKLFASWELGFGSMGYLTVGAGYRF